MSETPSSAMNTLLSFCLSCCVFCARWFRFGIRTVSRRTRLGLLPSPSGMSWNLLRGASAAGTPARRSRPWSASKRTSSPGKWPALS
ncbi:unnamed protein product, partial [Ectocarpus sp. 12 AP-2014]